MQRRARRRDGIAKEAWRPRAPQRGSLGRHERTHGSRRALLGALVLAAASGAARKASAEPDASAVEPRASVAETHDGAAGENGWFVDRWGQRRSFAAEYAAVADRPSHPVRAAIEMALLTATGTLYYLSDPLANEQNYDDPSMLEKLTGGAWCFDTNMVSTNFILHPLAGSAFYGMSRVNGLDVFPAFAYAFASSATWEYLLEWREQVSLNDLMMTPIGGIALGEFFFRLGEYVNSAPVGGSAGRTIAKYTLGLAQATHDAMDGRAPPSTLPPDDLGFSSAYWHEFGLGYQLGQLENDRGQAGHGVALDLQSRLVAMPGFRKPGEFSVFFDQGNVTEGSLRLLFDRELAEVDARVAAVLFGHYSQSYGPTGGFGALFGLRTGLRYYDSWRLERRDLFATVELPGPIAMFSAHSGPLVTELALAGHLDFGGLRPAAYPEYETRVGKQGVKSVLEKRGYAYYGCATGRADASAMYGALRVDASAQHSRCRSIDGLDRFHGLRDRELRLDDRVTEIDVSLRFPHPARVQAGLVLEERWHSGTMGPVEEHRHDRWTSAVVSYVF